MLGLLKYILPLMIFNVFILMSKRLTFEFILMFTISHLIIILSTLIFFKMLERINMYCGHNESFYNLTVLTIKLVIDWIYYYLNKIYNLLRFCCGYRY